MKLKRKLILFIVICLFCSACLPKSTSGGSISNPISRQNDAVEEEEETYPHHVLEEENVEELPIASWGEDVYNPMSFDQSGGPIFVIRNVTTYRTLSEADITLDDLHFASGLVKATEEDAAILSKKIPEDEWSGMVEKEQLLDAEGNIREGYLLLVLEAEVTNAWKENTDKKLPIGIALIDRNDIWVDDDPMLKELLYQTPYAGASNLVYLKEAVNQEKDAFKVELAQGESMQIHAYFFVPEDYSEYVGIPISSGNFSGGFFSLREDGQ